MFVGTKTVRIENGNARFKPTSIIHMHACPKVRNGVFQEIRTINQKLKGIALTLNF